MELENVLITLAISLIIQLVFFLIAFSFKTDKLTDFTYGLTFILLGIYVLVNSKTFGAAKFILISMIIIWALRLMIYLFYRILAIKSDSRFDEIRGNLVRFLSFWVFQGISAWIIMLPSIVFLSFAEESTFKSLSVIGIFIWFMGLTIETVADIQKFRFKSDTSNKKKWISSGLWRYSRHPNYFGEILCWLGIYLYVLLILGQKYYWLGLSPIYIFILLRFVSGIPILERNYAKRFADNEKYFEYKNKTSMLFLLPPRN
ncbi:MAG: DUF1295 domain-containing protein [Candidatus Dojkabacteria bacterium]|jgi:steroid 5-alpha reductase family enzyme|nr:DUF1295 domain-containing protein [Candidatus Dojkabacteria bacterium]